MKEYRIQKNESGMTVIAYLSRALPGAGRSLLYKQLRKKNINLCGKKAEGSERLKEGDTLQVYFSDETIAKFESAQKPEDGARAAGNIRVLFEDDDILAMDKAAGELSQQEKRGQISLNEEMLAYLEKAGAYSPTSPVKPSVCNRLDRNTSGIVLAGKTMEGLHFLNNAIRSGDVNKYYLSVALGRIETDIRAELYITKDEGERRAMVSEAPVSPDSKQALTYFTPLGSFENEEGWFTLLRVRLGTGRFHQIRASLSHLGHPIAGDVKYGDKKINKRLSERFGIKRQLLHAARVELPGYDVIESPIPEDFYWLPGIQEVCGDRPSRT